MDTLKIESHKLMYHVARVNDWLQGKDIYPIYVEIAPSGTCNHRCCFCAFDYLNYKPRFIKTGVLIKRITEMARCGVKSIMYSGDGEPLLHKDIVELVLHTKKAGIQAAMTTNGVLFDEAMAPQILGALAWVRVSLNAGTPETYAKIHRCDAKDFKKVIDNLINAVRLKRENNYTCTIGAQLLLLNNNSGEVTALARLLKGIGVDYLIIKPYSQHPMSRNKLQKNLDYAKHLHLYDKLRRFSGDNFEVIFRVNTMRKLEEAKPYKYCLGLPFWSYMDPAGDIYACSAFLGNKRFCYGNIYKNTFREIWKGSRRKILLDRFLTEIDIDECRKACRIDEVNRYLWELKNPVPHVDFI
jgi:GTP 3',8-cyclase